MYAASWASEAIRQTMKVTVCFGSVGVVVPCGTDGGMTIRTLIDEAVSRYKKATNKPVNHKVTVHRLRSTANHNAILDEDDLIRDVADNRDQLVAEYDETPSDVIPPPVSNSFSETVSPKVYSCNLDNNVNNNNNYNIHRKQIIGVDVLTDIPPEVFDGEKERHSTSEGGVETVNNVMAEAITIAVVGQPNQGISHPAQNLMDLALDPVTAPVKPMGRPHSFISDRASGHLSPCDVSEPTSPVFSAFTRNMTRKSLGNGLSMQKWYIAQEKLADQLEGSATKPVATITVPSSFASNNLPVVAVSRSAPDAYVPFVPGVKKPLDLCLSNPVPVDSTGSSTIPRRPPRHTRHSSVGGSLSVGTKSGHVCNGNGDVNSIGPASDISTSVISPTLATVSPATTTSPSSEPSNVSSASIESSKTSSAAAGCVNTTKTVCSSSPKQSAAGIIATPPVKSGVLAPTNTRRIGNKITIDLVKG